MAGINDWLNPKKPQKPQGNFLKDMKTAVQNQLKTGYFANHPSMVGNFLMGEPLTKNTSWGQKGVYQQKPIASLKVSPTPMPKIATNVLGVAKKAVVPTMNTQATKSGGLLFPKEVSPKPKQSIATRVSPTSSPTSMPTKPPTPTPTPDPRESWNNMAEMVIREGNKRGYHGETLARQKALESGFGQSNFAKQRYNYGGIGAYDSNPDNAWKFESPEAYLNAYFNLIEKDPRYTKAYANRANPRKYLTELKKAGYASDPNYIEKVLNTDYWNNNY